MWRSIQRNVTWRAIPIAALIAGAVFLAVNMLVTGLVLGLSPQTILRYAASSVLGPSVLTDTSFAVTTFGFLMHWVLSLLYTLIIAIVVHRWGLWVGIIGGGILGLCIYVIIFYAVTLIMPWLFAISGPLLAFNHVLLGAMAGGIYESLDTYDLPLQAGAA